jgi:hypothetical protein
MQRRMTVVSLGARAAHLHSRCSGILWAMEPDQPPLPRPPGDPENLRRLREEAAARVRREEIERNRSTPVYGGPPPLPPTRRWTLRGILIVIASALAAIAAALWGYRKISLPAYGGPPAPQPPAPPHPAPQEDRRNPAPAYGGPLPPQPPPPPPRAPAGTAR